MWPWVVFWVYFPSLKLNLVERACHLGTFETDSSAAGVKRSLNLNSITFGHDIIWYHLNGTPYGISWIWYLVSKKNCSYSWWYRPLKNAKPLPPRTFTSAHTYTHIPARTHVHSFTAKAHLIPLKQEHAPALSSDAVTLQYHIWIITSEWVGGWAVHTEQNSSTFASRNTGWLPVMFTSRLLHGFQDRAQ